MRDVSDLLWCDLETDAERMAFLVGGGAMRTGIMAEAITPDVVELLGCRLKIETLMQFIEDYAPNVLVKPRFWEAIGEHEKAAEIRESQLDCSPIPGLPTNRQMAEWSK